MVIFKYKLILEGRCYWFEFYRNGVLIDEMSPHKRQSILYINNDTIDDVCELVESIHLNPYTYNIKFIDICTEYRFNIKPNTIYNPHKYKSETPLYCLLIECNMCDDRKYEKIVTMDIVTPIKKSLLIQNTLL